MELEKFIKYQAESDIPLMCINEGHDMPLVATYDLDRVVELKCYTSYCDFKFRPGLQIYEKICAGLEEIENKQMVAQIEEPLPTAELPVEIVDEPSQ